MPYYWILMMNDRPVVGVTGPEKGGAAAWLFTRFAVWLQGGKAVRITPGKPTGIDRLDALILGGGADIHPEKYGQPLLNGNESPSPKPTGLRQWLIRIFSTLFYPVLFFVRKVLSVPIPATDVRRDNLELRLLEAAMKQELPVLGICRGAQLINVKMGGTLFQEIDGFYGEVPRIHSIWPRKKVYLEPGSRLRRLMDKPGITVNALHHQAIERLGDPLQSVAEEENGIIQAVEMIDYPFLIGVQWHPEYMPQVRSQRKIFRALVDSARNGRPLGDAG